MKHPIIAMIGTGNMGSSLIAGLIKHGHPASTIIASDPDQAKLAAVQKELGIRISDNHEAVATADVVILAVKPQHFAEVLKSLAPDIAKKKPLIISIAAGVTVTTIADAIGSDSAIIRSMPNTPAMIGCGATALFANANVTQAQKALAESILNAVGITVWIDNEALIDVVTALSGSGPAYFFLILEALQNTAEELGLPADIAKKLTLQTALGATRMAFESPKSLAELRQNVTSPGGTTEKAVSVLEEHNLRDIFRKALHSAKIRSEELAKLNRK